MECLNEIESLELVNDEISQLENRIWRDYVREQSDTVVPMVFIEEIQKEKELKYLINL